MNKGRGTRQDGRERLGHAAVEFRPKMFQKIAGDRPQRQRLPHAAKPAFDGGWIGVDGLGEEFEDAGGLGILGTSGQNAIRQRIGLERRDLAPKVRSIVALVDRFTNFQTRNAGEVDAKICQLERRGKCSEDEIGARVIVRCHCHEFLHPLADNAPRIRAQKNHQRTAVGLCTLGLAPLRGDFLQLAHGQSRKTPAGPEPFGQTRIEGSVARWNKLGIHLRREEKAHPPVVLKKCVDNLVKIRPLQRIIKENCRFAPEPGASNFIDRCRVLQEARIPPKFLEFQQPLHAKLRLSDAHRPTNPRPAGHLTGTWTRECH